MGIFNPRLPHPPPTKIGAVTSSTSDLCIKKAKKVLLSLYRVLG